MARTASRALHLEPEHRQWPPLPSHRSFREIVERLDVSVNTVKTQAHAIYRKLDAAGGSEAPSRSMS